MESFGTMIKEKNTLFNENEKLRQDIGEFNRIINDIITKLNKVRENLGIYYEIHRNIISNNNKFRNYEILFNINEFNNNSIKKDLETIIKDNNPGNQINNILKIYQKMETEQKESKILLYEPEPESESDFTLFNNEINNNNNQNNQQRQENNKIINNISNLSKSVDIKENKNPKINQNEINKQRSALFNLVNELQNIVIDEMNKLPLISELLDINELLKNYKENDPEISIVKLVTEKYQKYREVRKTGNSFYTCFIYRLFEFISLNRSKALFDKIYKKILDSKIIILNNGYDWDFLKDSYKEFKNEFNACFEQSLISMKNCREYLDKLFKNDEKFNYLNHFIHFCIAAYLKENRLLYEEYSGINFDTWISKVEEIGVECNQLEILACANYFDIGIKIEYLYPNKLDVIKLPEDKKGEEIFINILFKDDHYDILYK